MADIFDQAAAGARPQGDIFDRAGPAQASPAQRPSDLLPHPDEVDRQATANAREIAGDPMHATMSPAAPPSIWQRITAPFVGGMTGDIRAHDTPISRVLGGAQEPPAISKQRESMVDFENAVSDVGPGVIRGTAEFASGLTTPKNLLLVAGTGGLGALEGQLGKGLVSRLVSAGFSASMLHDAYQQIPGLRESWDRGDWPDVRQQLTRIVLGGGMAALAAKHAIRGRGAGEAKVETQPKEEYTITGQRVRAPGGDIFDRVPEEKNVSQPTATVERAVQPQGQSGTTVEEGRPAGSAESGVQQSEAAKPAEEASVKARAADQLRETGPHGPVWHEYSGTPADAIAHLQKVQTGEVPRVWHNPELAKATNTDGWIGLTWGNLKGGLAHIIDKHVVRQKDLTLDDLARMIPEMEVVPGSNDGRSVRLQSDRHHATVRLDFNGAENRWLVTAFEKRPPTGESPTGSGSPMNRGGGPGIPPPGGPSVPPPPEGGGGAPDSSMGGGDSAVKGARGAENQRRIESEAVRERSTAAAVDAGATGALDSGRTGEGRAVHGTAAPVAGRAFGEDTDVLIPGEERAIRARYEVRELADIQPSHHGQTFSPNERYTRKNERDYAKSENQQRVIENSSEERFNPRYHVSDNPDATNGPTLIDEDGNAIGGNNRAMMLQRVYGRDGQSAAAYRALLEKKASQFGIDPEALRGMKQPVLVRVASNAELESLPGGSKWAVRKTNVSGTAQLSASERAAADAGQLAPELVDHIAAAIDDAGPDATLNDALTGKSGTAIVNRLIAEGFFNEQERPALMDGKTGALTQLAKDRISKAMLGQFFRDSDQISRTPAAIKAKLERIAAPLSKVQGNADWDLTPAVREAVDLIEFANAHGIKNLGDVVAQENMFGGAPEWHSDAVSLAEWLRDRKPNDLVSAVRKYVGDREPTMFGERTPAEAFGEHFGGEKSERPQPAAAEPAPVRTASGSPGEPVPSEAGLQMPPEPGKESGSTALPAAENVPTAEQKSALGQFWGEEEGSSTAGAILRADIDEVRSLMAKRKAALDAFEKEQNSPATRIFSQFGQRLIRYYTGERDLWVSRVNQVLDRLGKLVPDPTEREGISLMRDFKGRPGELASWLDGTHPNLLLLEAADRAAAMARIEKLRPSIEKAMNPTARMLQADQVLTRIADASAAEGIQRGFLERGWNAQQYFTHILARRNESEMPTPVLDRMGKALGGKISRRFAFAEHRTYPTVLDAIVDNVRPRTLDPFAAFAIHGDKFATARATHLLIDRLHDTSLGKWYAATDRRIPEGWVPAARHSDLFSNVAQYVDPTTGGPVLAEQKLYVPKIIDKALRPITDPDYMDRLPAFSALRHFQAYTKAVQLGLSFFHATTENYMALANMGPKGWIKGLRADRESPDFLKAERDFITQGGTTSILGRTVEAYKALQPGSIPTWGDIWKRAPVIRQVDQLAEKITDYTFDNLQRKFKVTDYQVHKAAWLADHPGATAEDTATALNSIAKEINAVYGGLNWEQLGVNHMTVEVARAMMLAPDWTVSNIFNLKYSMEKGTPAGKLARMFWIRQVAGGMAATQMLSLMLSRHPSPRPTMVYMGKDRDGQEIYQNVFFKGAPGDITNLITNVKDYGAVGGLSRSMAGKAAPVFRTGLQLMTNRDYLGRQLIPKGMSPIASTVRGAYEFGKGVAPTPLSLLNLKDMLIGPNADRYKVPEWLFTPFAGNPPQHVPPEGYRMTKKGLREKPPRESHSIFEEIVTGKR